MAAEHERYDGADPLTAALTDEPLPCEARADTAFMAEYRAVRADVVLLREQLESIGDALAGPVPQECHVPEPPVRARQRVRRHPGVRAVTTGALAAAAVASVVFGLGLLVARGGGAGTDSGGSADKASAGAARRGSSFGAPGYLACARLVAEGDVTDVVRVPGTGQDRVTLRVTRSYKPAGERGDEKGVVAFTMDDPLDFGRGAHLLVGIPRHADSPDVWIVGEQDIAPQRQWIEQALPRSRSLTCT
ncbi:hypothetical protein [Streptomyces sp. NPDC046197]|uniref:hypothetical protein n=1 Tax=Streptomyces sp. NPDC046197 TaxID=3154337 RepID=UPI0033DEDA9B